MKLRNRLDYRRRRHQRLRRTIIGTAERPRMCVCITSKHLYVQLIDDEQSKTIVAVSSLGEEGLNKNNIAAAEAIGKKASELAKAKGIKAVVFDRGGHAYHGRVKAVAEAARAAGIKL